MTATHTTADRAAEVIASRYPCATEEDGTIDLIREDMRALDAAGLLVTDEARTVILAAVRWHKYTWADELSDAVVAYLASRPVTP